MKSTWQSGFKKNQLSPSAVLLYVLFLWCDRFDGDCVENNPEAVMDKSKSWSRSIEDLHGGSTLPSPITGNGFTRAGRHSTIRYNAHDY